MGLLLQRWSDGAKKLLSRGNGKQKRVPLLRWIDKMRRRGCSKLVGLPLLDQVLRRDGSKLM